MTQWFKVNIGAQQLEVNDVALGLGQSIVVEHKADA
jgi:hypothetical protein